MLGTLATAGVVAMLAVLVTWGLVPERLAALRTSMAGSGTTMAAAVALVATGGSLWFSEVAHFQPCELCWYQRIGMYPLALLLPVAAWRADPSIRLYAIILAVAGLGVSLWHNAIETFPEWGSGTCDPANPCTLRWVEGLGFWTIPRMAAVAFALVIVALLLDRPTEAT